MSEQIKKEASEKIAAILKEIDSKFKEAQKIAEEASVDFRYEGQSYGMGGNYTPASWESSDEYGYTSEDVGWQASSQSCF